MLAAKPTRSRGWGCEVQEIFAIVTVVPLVS